MKKQLPSLLLATALAVTPALGQSLSRELSRAGQAPTASAAQSKTGIRLAPGSKFSIQPSQVFSFLKGQRSGTQKPAFAAPRRIAATENVADSLLLYGLNIQDYTYRSPSPLPTQFYSFQAARSFSYTQESQLEMVNPMAGFYAKGKYYALYSAMNYDENYNSLTTSRVDVYDATTWQLLESKTICEGDLGMNYYFRQVGVYDPTTDKAYCMGWGDWDGLNKPLIEVDLETLQFTVLGATEQFIQALFISKDGGLYGLSFADEMLYQLDKATGAATAVAMQDTGLDTSADVMGTATDPATGTVYWVAVNGSTYASALYTIDLSTAHCEKLCDMPGNEHFMGLYIPYVDADAPAAASKIDYKDGKLCFTVPTTTYTSGQALGDDLKAVVTVDGTVDETAVSAGQQVELALELVNGKHVVTVAVGNAAGLGAVRRLESFIGQDVPTAVTDLTITADDGKHVVLTWSKPTSSVYGGDVDENEINYRVTRYPDETVVADNLKETTFTEPFPERRARYYYVVTAKNGQADGQSAKTDVVSGGTVYYPPFTEGFDSQADFDSFTIVDANNDQCTWLYMSTWDGLTYAYLSGNGTNDPESGTVATYNDDYLISLPIALVAGQDYRVSFDTYDQWYYHESMRLLLGQTTQPTGDEQLIADVDMEGNKHYTFLFHVEADGQYRLMLHANTVGSSINLSVDNLSVSIYAAFEGPGAVENLTAQAGAEGTLTNTISFTTPTQTYQGQPLSAISRVDIFRDGAEKPVKTFENPATGEQLTWVDEDVANGEHTYRVVAFNEQGQGMEALVTNWVGLDVPGAIPDVKVHMNADGFAEVTWSQVSGKGQHGGYVAPDDVKYVLCRYNEWSWDDQWPEVTDLTSEFTLVDDQYMGWGQEYVKYMLVAVNAAGRSAGEQFGIVLGTPYDLPYTESFDFYGMAMPAQNPWTLFADTYYYAWEIVDGAGLAVKPFDGDAGMLKFTYIDGDSNPQIMSGPRVSLLGTETPELSFYMYHGFEAEPEDLTLDIFVNYDDEGWQKVQTIAYNNGATGWARNAVQLRNDANNVQFAFQATAADASASIYIDAIKIAEGVANDLALESITLGQKRIEAGKGTTVTVGISNYGMQAASDYSVVLSCDGEEVASKNAGELVSNQSAQVVFDVTTTKHDASKTFVYTAQVVAASDGNDSNNSSATVKLFVKGSSLPTAQYLSGTQQGATVSLAWSAPATDEQTDPVTDDFEGYDSFIINGIGDWVTYDGDGTQTVYFGGPEVPNAFEPKAWQIWAPVEAGFSLERFPVLIPHSGDKVLASWAASDGIEKTLESDDWLISSDITGGSDLSFWYRVPNDGSDPQVFEILYSTTDQEPESFVVLDRDSLAGTTDWRQFEYTLPAEAKYFAIRNCSYGSYTVAFIDDIKYTPLYGSQSKLSLKGYNVYRDDELIATEVNDTAYVDTNDGSIHVYAVSAVWAEGEANLSNDYVCDEVPTGIELVERTAGTTRKQSWNVAGQRVGQAWNGMRIIRVDGQTRKVLK